MLANRYRMIKKLGEGGFGQTFLAQDVQMPSQRTCVIKQLKPMTANPEIYQMIQERFQREATVLEKLGERSRQIPSLYAYFCENQEFFLIQEWIEGATLSDRIHAQTVLSAGAVREILLNLLPVLEFIHSQGIIHRDIKPDNIIIRQADQLPVLIDFGAVRETMGTVFNSKGHPTSSIVIGTPGYMPSEQAAGRPIASSDLYSLGLTAIYALTGKMPHEFITDPQTGEILWRNRAPDLSPEFADVLEKATRSHPRDRYSSAHQMLAALQGETLTQSIPPIQPISPLNAPTMAVSVPSVPPTVAPTGQPTIPATAQPFVQPTVPVTASPPSLSNDAAPPKSTTSLVLPSLILGGLVSAAILIGFVLTRSPASIGNLSSVPNPAPNPASPSPDQDSPSPDLPDSTPDPTSQTVDPIASPSPDPEIVASPEVVPPEPNRPIAQPISEELVLVSAAGDPVNIYAQPSTRSAAPHYGLEGDRVTALEQIQGEDGYTWYFVQFPSGADGWIRSDAVRSSQVPPPVPESPVSFPQTAQIIGQTSGSRVNVRSTPSTRANSPHYGLVGDRVTVLEQAQGDDGRTWYSVQFSSGATGWIREDFVELQ
ncbi:protein kinase domain-containing protein [Egbenema bharatensis]|uniref:protein kinase domain-containing protein n=1 Tax=Egbenema bharatensis TaxID=3463334 RepID=UPI003A85223C